MGYVRVRGYLSNLARTRSRDLEFLADTGSFFTLVADALVRELEIDTPLTYNLTLADGKSVRAEVGLALIRPLGREGPTLVAVINPPVPVIGVGALEVLQLRVNPITKALEPYGPGGAWALLGGPGRR